MEADFQTYQKYPTLAAAEELLALLQQHNMSYRLQEDRATVEPAFAFNRLTNGQLVPAFSAQERVHGLRIAALGVVSLVAWVVLRLYFGRY